MKQQQKIVSFIALIVILTIGIQIYWNYAQYANNRLMIINDIQNTLDEVVKEYSKNQSEHNSTPSGGETAKIDAVDSASIQKIISNVLKELADNKQIYSVSDNPETFSYTIILDSINLTELDSLLKQEFIKNKFKIDYKLTVIKNGKTTDSLGREIDSFKMLTAKSQINPIYSNTIVKLNYTNPIISSLVKGLAGIISSFVLVGIVIFALYYLLYIIRKQKQLSEIKNDFISNVTHEFKTPIATVSSAIEAIKNFNNENITEKTKRYLDVSEQQLKKLNILVEKVMETSLLESSELNLDKQKTDIIKLLKDCTEKLQLNTRKKIQFKSDVEIIELEVDEFHFENAISNLVDNAIKYGGNDIKLTINKDGERIIIFVNDNGAGISNEDKPYIFDKFFRSKEQNNNRIKGFGIGLYYTKNIIEKHNGTIELRNRNTFLITLWTK